MLDNVYTFTDTSPMQASDGSSIPVGASASQEQRTPSSSSRSEPEAYVLGWGADAGGPPKRQRQSECGPISRAINVLHDAQVGFKLCIVLLVPIYII